MKNLREAGIAAHSSRQVRQENFTGRSFLFRLFYAPPARVEHRGGLETRYQPEG
jgi:hypothetical protein